MPPRYFNRIKNSLWCYFSRSLSLFPLFYLFIYDTYYTRRSSQCTISFEVRFSHRTRVRKSQTAKQNAPQRVEKKKNRKKDYRNGKSRDNEKKGKRMAQNWHFIINKLKVRLTFPNKQQPGFNFSPFVSLWRENFWWKQNFFIQFVDRTQWNCLRIGQTLQEWIIRHRCSTNLRMPIECSLWGNVFDQRIEWFT